MSVSRSLYLLPRLLFTASLLLLLAARASNNLASVSYLEGRVPEARSLYREALLSYQRLGDRRVRQADNDHKCVPPTRIDFDFDRISLDAIDGRRTNLG